MIEEKEIDIVQLEYPENIQKRPGMFIGSTQCPDVILREAIDNSIDELMGSIRCNSIDIQIASGRSGSWYVVSDNGRGIPITIDGKKGITKTELAVASLNAGSKFKKGKGDVSTGMNGVGVSCILSDTEVIVYDGNTNSIKVRSVEELLRLQSTTNLKVVTSDGNLSDLIDVFKTKEVDELVELTFEDGSVIKCTPDHKFLLTNGTYIEAKDITPDTDLESFKIRFKLDDVINSRIPDVKGPLIYRIHNLINDESYVGRAKDTLLTRFTSGEYGGCYRWCIDHSVGGHLTNAINSLGIENFDVEVVHFGDKPISGVLPEEYYITKYDSYRHGYNATEDGLGSYHSKTSKAYARKCCKEKKRGFYDPALQSELGKRGGDKRVLNMRNRGECFFNPEFQSRMAVKGALSSIFSTIDQLLINNLAINEYNFNSSRNKAPYTTFRAAFNYLPEITDKYGDKVASEFNENNLLRSPHESARLLIPELTSFELSKLTQMSNSLKSMNPDEFNEEYYESNKIPHTYHYDKVLKYLNLMMDCGYITEREYLMVTNYESSK